VIGKKFLTGNYVGNPYIRASFGAYTYIHMVASVEMGEI